MQQIGLQTTLKLAGCFPSVKPIYDALCFWPKLPVFSDIRPFWEKAAKHYGIFRLGNVSVGVG